ncbi:sulfatase-like hydrolase/transferase [Haloarchaeobius sp. DFWS5]|uniref:sulfatase-like hydrolase/transferase n=1 Tax=Haloarchaeobius sp. DFWS5 TaxID=3446114 RepID=UPI003EB83971
MTRNVALIVLDTVRKDSFDEFAPRLRQMSDTSFEQARAASSWSLPSHTSIFTGQLPSQHGVHAESFDAGFDFGQFDRSDTFLGRLPDHRAVGLSANSYMNPAFGLDAWFDEFGDFSIGSHTAESLFTEAITVDEYMKNTDEPNAAKRYLGFLSECLSHDEPAKSFANGVWAFTGHHVKKLPIPEFVDDGAKNISARALETAEGDEPFFLFANYMDAHTPLRNLVQHDTSMHEVPNSWSSKELNKWELNADGAATDRYTRYYRDVYNASIDYLDRKVSDTIARMQAASDEEISFVVISDHGHNLGYASDDGKFHHTSSMSEGIVHTPCEIINPPEGWPSRVDDYFSHCLLGDLIVKLANEEPYSEDLVDDRMLSETIGLLGGENATWDRDFSDDELAYWNRMMRVAYIGETKYEWNSLGESYEYRIDHDIPCWQEEVDDDAEIPEWATEAFGNSIEAYKQEAEGTEQDDDFDEEVEEQLKELGYL